MFAVPVALPPPAKMDAGRLIVPVKVPVPPLVSVTVNGELNPLAPATIFGAEKVPLPRFALVNVAVPVPEKLVPEEDGAIVACTVIVVVV